MKWRRCWPETPSGPDPSESSFPRRRGRESISGTLASCSFPRLRGKVWMGARAKRASGHATTVRPHPGPPPQAGEGADLRHAGFVLLPPLAGEGRDGGAREARVRPCCDRPPPPRPSPAGGGGSRSAAGRPCAPSPACGGRSGWGRARSARRAMLRPSAPTPALPRRRGREPIDGAQSASVHRQTPPPASVSPLPAARSAPRSTRPSCGSRSCPRGSSRRCSCGCRG